MRENMLPVIEKFTGTEYSTAGFVITAILLLLITGFAGYITGKSAAESFGGNKKKIGCGRRSGGRPLSESHLAVAAGRGAVLSAGWYAG